MSPWPPDNELLLERYAYVCTQLRAAQNAGNRADVGRWQAEKDEIVQRFDGMVSSRRIWRVLAAVSVLVLIGIAAAVAA
jgi:hypothetical protein